jgi:WD40 repeat protein
VREWKKVTKSHIEVSTRQGDIFVTGSEDGEIHIYDLKTGKCQNQFTAHISFVGLHMVGDVLVSGAKDGKLFFWDIHTGARLRTLCHLRGLFAFKVVGNKIFCGYDDEVRIWTFEKPKEDIIDDDDDDNLYSDNDDDF